MRVCGKRYGLDSDKCDIFDATRVISYKWFIRVAFLWTLKVIRIDFRAALLDVKRLA